MSYPGLPLKSALQQTWSRIGEGTLNLVYPRTCRACQAGLTAFEQPSGLTDWLCTPCLEELTAIEPPYCSVCGEAFAGAMERAFKCSNCDGRRMAFDFAISGFIKPPPSLGTNDRGSGTMGESAPEMRGRCKGDAGALQGVIRKTARHGGTRANCRADPPRRASSESRDAGEFRPC